MLLIYVNDIAVAVKAIFEVIWFKNVFKKMFKIKNLKKIEKILEIRITRDRQRRTLRMNQTHYLKKVIDRLHMRREDKHKSIDILMNEYVALRFARSDDERTNQLKYQHAIESLMYVAIHTRSNIAFSLRRLSQYLSDSTTYHWHALKSLIRYVRSIVDLDITYESSENIVLNEYFDFDYAADAIFRKSILEYVYMLVEDSIFWMSKKQKFVIISIIEVEYMTMSICAKKRLWISQVLRDLNLVKYIENDLNRVDIKKKLVHQSSFATQLVSMQLKRDNQSSLTLIKDAHVHERSKHIDVVYHNIRDLFKRKLIRVDFVLSQNMIADEFTKSLSKEIFKKFIEQLELRVSES